MPESKKKVNLISKSARWIIEPTNPADKVTTFNFDNKKNDAPKMKAAIENLIVEIEKNEGELSKVKTCHDKWSCEQGDCLPVHSSDCYTQLISCHINRPD
jgi:hypothetical protein